MISLMAAYPGTWALTTAIFMFAVESTTVVPYLGVLIKLSLGALLTVQTLVMFTDAASGRRPSLSTLLRAFARPLDTQLVIVLSGLLPFLCGVAYLACIGGAPAARFFFDRLHVTQPTGALLLQTKYLMYLTSLPFTFVGTAVVFEHQRGARALARGLSLARAQLPVLGVNFAISCAFEWSTTHAIKVFSQPALRAGLALVLVAAFVACSFAFIAAVALRMYRLQPQDGSQPARVRRQTPSSSLR